jgi:hypothetical protein
MQRKKERAQPPPPSPREIISRWKVNVFAIWREYVKQVLNVSTECRSRQNIVLIPTPTWYRRCHIWHEWQSCCCVIVTSLIPKGTSVYSRDLTSPEVVVMKSSVFCDTTPCSAVKINTFPSNVSSIKTDQDTILQVCSACYLLHTGFLLGLIFIPESRTDMLLRNVCWLSPSYMAIHSRRYNFLLVELFVVYLTTLPVTQTCAPNIRMRVNSELERKWNLASTSRPI